jgi:hypothetical protein
VYAPIRGRGSTLRGKLTPMGRNPDRAPLHAGTRLRPKARPWFGRAGARRCCAVTAALPAEQATLRSVTVCRDAVGRDHHGASRGVDIPQDGSDDAHSGDPPAAPPAPSTLTYERVRGGGRAGQPQPRACACIVRTVITGQRRGARRPTAQAPAPTAQHPLALRVSTMAGMPWAAVEFACEREWRRHMIRGLVTARGLAARCSWPPDTAWRAVLEVAGYGATENFSRPALLGCTRTDCAHCGGTVRN